MSNIRYYTDGEQATADTLNRPLKDLNVLQNIISKAEFEALAKNNRKKYSSSGQVSQQNSFKKFISNDSFGTNWMFRNLRYNDNLKVPNALLSSLHSTSFLERAYLPNFNVAGYNIYNVVHNKYYVNRDTEDNILNDTNDYSSGGGILFPEVDDFLREGGERLDFLFLEVWPEKIDSKGEPTVFWRGCVQTSVGDTGIEELGINNQYSSFFDGHTPTQSKCYTWNDKSDEWKIDFAQNPENNLFLDGDDIYQLRWRFRIAININSNIVHNIKNTSETLRYKDLPHPDASQSYLCAQGHLDTITYYGTGSNAYVNFNHNSSDSYGLDARDPGVWYRESGTRKNGCYMVPIGVFNRGNKGVYHEILNPHGSGVFKMDRELINVNGNWILMENDGKTSSGWSGSREEAELLLFNDDYRGWGHHITSNITRSELSNTIRHDLTPIYNDNIPHGRGASASCNNVVGTGWGHNYIRYVIYTTDWDKGWIIYDLESSKDIKSLIYAPYGSASLNAVQIIASDDLNTLNTNGFEDTSTTTASVIFDGNNPYAGTGKVWAQNLTQINARYIKLQWTSSTNSHSSIAHIGFYNVENPTDIIGWSKDGITDGYGLGLIYLKDGNDVFQSNEVITDNTDGYFLDRRCVMTKDGKNYNFNEYVHSNKMIIGDKEIPSTGTYSLKYLNRDGTLVSTNATLDVSSFNSYSNIVGSGTFGKNPKAHMFFDWIRRENSQDLRINAGKI